MARRVALGILSVFTRTIQEVAYTFEDQPIDTAYGDGKGRYRGYLTNIAPMECLIDLAASEGTPVEKIVYLTSPETRMPSSARTLPDGRTMTPEEYFRHELFAYYQLSGDRLPHGPASAEDVARDGKDGFFVPIEYDEKDPVSSLQSIIDTMGADKVLVDVDTTGGPRDAAALATIAIQVIKARYSLPNYEADTIRAGLGNTVYARLYYGNGVTGNIERQGSTYDLIDLINAIGSFTSFGKAGPLIEFFSRDSDGHKTSNELKSLLQSMGKFSDDLALCRVKDVPQHVSTIYRRFDDLRVFHKKNGARRAFAKRASAMLESRADSGDSATFEDVKARVLNGACDETGLVAASDSDYTNHPVFRELPEMYRTQLAACNGVDGLMHWVQVLIWSTNVRRAELLFMSLLGGVEKDFVEDVGRDPKDEDRARQTIGIIRWCVSRQLLAQALSLVREFYPACMGQLGYVSWGSEPLRLQRQNEEKIARIRQIANYQPGKSPAVDARKLADCVLEHTNEFGWGAFGKLSEAERERIVSIAFPGKVADARYLSVNDGAEAILPAMLIWYKTIVSLRNEILHANEEANKKDRAKKYHMYAAVIARPQAVRCLYDQHGTPEELSRDILTALDALEGAIVLKFDFDYRRDELARRIRDAMERRGVDLVRWDEIFPDQGDDPTNALSGALRLKRRRAIINSFCVDSEHGRDFSYVPVIRVRPKARNKISSRKGSLPAYKSARDFLLDNVKRARPGIVAFDDAMARDRELHGGGGTLLLEKKTLGLRQKGSSVFSSLCAAYPETFTEEGPYVRLRH